MDQQHFQHYTRLLMDDPVQAVSVYPLVSTSLLLLLPIITFLLFSTRKAKKRDRKHSLNTTYIEDDIQKAIEFATTAPLVPSIWYIGVSAGGVSVVNDGTLRYFLATSSKKVPTDQDIVNCVLLGMHSPICDVLAPLQSPIKPSIVAFNALCTVSADMVKKVTVTLEKFDVSVRMQKDITELERATITKEKAAYLKSAATASKSSPIDGDDIATAKMAAALAAADPMLGEKPDFRPAPPRCCYVCRQQMVDKKPSQCSACKAIIYCSSECAKKDWPQHKQICPMFKTAMSSIETKKLHSFPFEFYKTNAPLQIYNAVLFLIREGLHNVGLYRRICHCFDKVPFAEMSVEFEKELSKLESNKEKAVYLGLPDELYPLTATIPFDDHQDKKTPVVNNWEEFYKLKKLSLSHPAALVLEYPMTVYHILTKYVFPKGVPTNEPIEIHMPGAEKECDLVHLFAILVGLLPGVDLTIRMIGPAVSSALTEEQRKYSFANEETKSKLAIHLVTGFYELKHYTGEAFDQPNHKPNAVLMLNPALLAHETWVPTIKFLMENRANVVVTDLMEPNVELLRVNMMRIGFKITEPHQVNPFRCPIHRWTPDCNFPSFSNGFICLLN